MVETKKAVLWSKVVTVQKAILIPVTNIQFYCYNCKRVVHKEWRLETVRRPNYYYMVNCPHCGKTEDIYL